MARKEEWDLAHQDFGSCSVPQISSLQFPFRHFAIHLIVAVEVPPPVGPSAGKDFGVGRSFFYTNWGGEPLN